LKRRSPCVRPAVVPTRLRKSGFCTKSRHAHGTATSCLLCRTGFYEITARRRAVSSSRGRALLDHVDADEMLLVLFRKLTANRATSERPTPTPTIRHVPLPPHVPTHVYTMVRGAIFKPRRLFAPSLPRLVPRNIMQNRGMPPNAASNTAIVLSGAPVGLSRHQRTLGRRVASAIPPIATVRKG
jgi:hypothetical protein